MRSTLPLFALAAALVGGPGAAAAEPATWSPRVELELRRVEAEAELAAAALRYGERHPAIVEASGRLGRLRGAIAALKRKLSDAEEQQLAARLEARLAEVKRERITLGQRYGDAHPEIRALDRRARVFLEHLGRLPAQKPRKVRQEASRAQLLVARARLRGLLAHARLSKGEAHPLVVSAREQLAAAEARLAELAPAGKEEAAAVSRAFRAAVEETRVRLETTAEAAPEAAADIAELEWVLDALVMGAAAHEGR